MATVGALREHLTASSTAGPDLTIGQLCPQCGGSDHGRPWARTGMGDIPVSAARAGSVRVTVALLSGAGGNRIGVDVERASPVELGPALVLHPDETGRDLLETWVAKEAILKMLGVGLTVPMPSIRVTDFDVSELDAPPGLVARVCVGRAQTQAGRAGR